MLLVRGCLILGGRDLTLWWHVIDHVSRCQVFACGPKTGLAFLRFFLALWYVGGGGGCNNVVCLRCHRCLPLHGSSFTSLDTFYVTLNTSPVGWGGWGVVKTVIQFTSVNTLHVTLHTSFVLRWTHFMLRCTRLVYFGEDTSCYVAHVFCTSVNTLHVTLRTSFVLRWRHFMLRCTKTVRRVQRGSPKVLAHTGTIDNCWKACKKMLPGTSLYYQVLHKTIPSNTKHFPVLLCTI